MGTPISRLQSTDSQSHFAQDDSQDTQLCQRCNELDFENRINPTAEASFALEIDRRALDFACSLCKLLGTVYDANDLSFFTIHWPSGSEQQLSVKFTNDASTIGLVTYKFSVSLPRSSRAGAKPSLDPTKIDFEVLRTKFEYCKAHHTDTFWAPEGSDHPETAKDACCPTRVTVENLRVFNCDTKLVEMATVETKYAALSYVWGNPDTKDQYPQTILDACKVAQTFGLKYIWIDQLCIDQEEGLDKMEHIRHMHHIYGNAELTIIAAAGHNSAYGIPAVREGSRRELAEFKIGSLRLVETNPSPEKIIKGTTWAKRAWTYQEEMFSNRLLVFTDHGAWFSCRRIAPEYGWEHLDPYDDQSWDWEDISDRSHEHYYWRGAEPGFPRNISDMIGDFSGRALTYEADIVNACSGCLGRLEEAKPPIHHLWGSPIPLHLPDRPEHGSLDGFVRGLLWFPRGDKFNSLKRRVGFPSWSWTGWIGVVIMRAYTRYGFQWVPKTPTEVSVALELTTGERLDWPELEKRLFLKDHPELMSPFIILGAWTIPMRLELCQVVGKPGSVVRAVTKTTSGEEIFCEFDLLGKDLDSSEELKTLLNEDVFTGIFLYPRSENRLVLMLAMESGECHVRVGYVIVANVYVRDGSGKISGPSHDPDIDSLRLERKEIRLG